ncbi:MAG: hypothetical protein ACTH5W_19985 [Providencia sp.]|uniref:hypothetical protein n=1 Tax=Providencia sp. TaxID=589 RepID=UPI003F969A7C
MKISDDLLDIAADIESMLHKGEDVYLVEWQAELLVSHFKASIRNKPIGYISEDGLDSLSKNSDAITSSQQQYDKVIPLYRLD